MGWRPPSFFWLFLFVSYHCCWKGWTCGYFLPKCVCLSTPQGLAEGDGPFNIIRERVIFWTLVYIYIHFPWYHLNIQTPTHILWVKCCTQIVIFSLTAEVVPNLIWNRNWAEGNGHSIYSNYLIWQNSVKCWPREGREMEIIRITFVWIIHWRWVIGDNGKTALANKQKSINGSKYNSSVIPFLIHIINIYPLLK